MAGEDYRASNITTSGISRRNGRALTPTDIIKKTISYVAFGDTAILGAVGSQKVLDLATSATTYGASITPKKVRVINEGKTSVVAMFIYEEYTGELASGDASSLQALIKPGEAFEPPIQAIINTVGTTGPADTQMLEGTAISNVVPHADRFVASGATVDDANGTFHSDADITRLFIEEYTSATNCGANLFRIGDLIRVDNEILEVTAIGDKSNLANNYLDVIRGAYGTTPVIHVDGKALNLPFFNAYHDFDKYTVAQTDNNGKFKSNNFFGYGRTATGECGITPSSVCLKFYAPGYQELGMSGITSSTESGLATSTIYGFDITVDGSGLVDSNSMRFTTSSNTKFGGSDGVIRKIQDVLDTLYYTSGNLLEEKVTVSIVNGDIRFTSGQRLSTSAILLATGSVGMDTAITPFGVGRIPAIGEIMKPILAKLPDDVVYDRITYATSPNAGALSYDDAYGNLVGGAITGGTINYETGAVDFRGPSNAEFVITALYNSPFSGKIKSKGGDAMEAINSLQAIHANTTNQKHKAKLRIELY